MAGEEVRRHAVDADAGVQQRPARPRDPHAHAAHGEPRAGGRRTGRRKVQQLHRQPLRDGTARRDDPAGVLLQAYEHVGAGVQHPGAVDGEVEAEDRRRALHAADHPQGEHSGDGEGGGRRRGQVGGASPAGAAGGPDRPAPRPGRVPAVWCSPAPAAPGPAARPQSSPVRRCPGTPARRGRRAPLRRPGRPRRPPPRARRPRRRRIPSRRRGRGRCGRPPAPRSRPPGPSGRRSGGWRPRPAPPPPSYPPRRWRPPGRGRRAPG